VSPGRGTLQPGRPGDLEAHATAVVEATSRDVLGYFLRRVGPPEDAADLLGETLLVVWRRVDHLPADPLEARLCMFGIARRVLSTHRRSGARRVALADRLRGEIEVHGAVVEPPDAAHPVRALLLELSPLDQEIIRLVHWEGFALVDVARVLDAKPATVRSRYARARAALRRGLDEQDRRS